MNDRFKRTRSASKDPTEPENRSDRRYTDQEVALVLQRAAEIEEQRSTSSLGTRGLTLRELHEIAREVGLSPDVINEALSTLTVRARARGSSLLGAPLSHKLVRGVPGNLGKEALPHLIHVIENHVDATGTVTDALGIVRWTSVSREHKFGRSIQVSLSTSPNETQIQVVHRYPSGLRAVLQVLPGLWGAGLGAAVVGSLGLAFVPAIGVVVGAAALGAGIGRSVWHAIARRSEREAEKVAAELVAATSELVDR